MIKTFNEFINEDITDVYSRLKHRRNRQQDNYNPEFIDFGESSTVLWSCDNLVIKNKDVFNWDEIHEYNNNGWRLPTIDELNQIDWNTKRIYGMRDGDSYYKFIEFPCGKIRINDDEHKINGGFHIWTSDFDKKFDTCAYAFGFDNSYKFNIDSYSKFNRMYVILVKSINNYEKN